MEKMKGPQQKKLMKMAHNLKPVVIIGHKGVSGTLLLAIDDALEDHELIKIKFGDHKDEKLDLLEQIIEETECEIVNVVGNIAILYREKEEE